MDPKLIKQRGESTVKRKRQEDRRRRTHIFLFISSEELIRKKPFFRKEHRARQEGMDKSGKGLRKHLARACFPEIRETLHRKTVGEKGGRGRRSGGLDVKTRR